MALIQKKEASKTVVLDDTKKEAKNTKKSTKTKETAKKSNKKERFLSPKGLKTEYSKISWPTRKKIISDTVIIIIFLVISSAIIGLADYGISRIITALTKNDAVQQSYIKAGVATAVVFAFWLLIYVLLRDRGAKKSS